MRKFFDYIFAISQMVFLLLGSAIVVTQMFGVVTLDGQTAEWAKKTLALPAFYTSCVTGLTGFVLSYFYKWNLDD